MLAKMQHRGKGPAFLIALIKFFDKQNWENIHFQKRQTARAWEMGVDFCWHLRVESIVHEYRKILPFSKLSGFGRNIKNFGLLVNLAYMVIPANNISDRVNLKCTRLLVRFREIPNWFKVKYPLNFINNSVSTLLNWLNLYIYYAELWRPQNPNDSLTNCYTFNIQIDPKNTK